MDRLVLVRHAATEWTGRRYCGRTDLPLSDAGRQQLAGLAEQLQRLDLSVADLRSGPARRALETASAIARGLNAEVAVDDRVREVDFGAVEGCTFDELARGWPALGGALLREETEIDWPAGETARDVRARVALVLQDLEAVAGDVVLVTHGGIVLAAARLLGAPAAAARIGPAGVLVLEPGARRGRIDASSAPAAAR